jgi:hypothetical protein
MSIAGDMIKAMKSLFLRARDGGGHYYSAFYELNDDELEQMLIDSSTVSIILANANGTTYDETNERSRALLHGSGVDIVDRMLITNSSCKLMGVTFLGPSLPGVQIGPQPDYPLKPTTQ